MGSLSLDGVTVATDAPRKLSDSLLSDIAAERAATRARQAEALARVHSQFGKDCDVLALLEISKSVEMRANAFRSSYAYFAGQLDVIAGGLSFEPWSKIVSYLTARIEHEIETRGRLWGSSQPATNMLAARIVARVYAAREMGEVA